MILSNQSTKNMFPIRSKENIRCLGGPSVGRRDLMKAKDIGKKDRDME